MLVKIASTLLVKALVRFKLFREAIALLWLSELFNEAVPSIIPHALVSCELFTGQLPPCP